MLARKAILAVLVVLCAPACLAAEPPASSAVIRFPGKETSASQYVPRETMGNKLGPGRSVWPKGMATAPVRFIRLQYDGGDWDLNMGAGADYNFLIQFNKLTGFKTAAQTESILIPLLQRFPKDRAPPFVYLTGSGDIGVSAAEVKVLRRYCLEEGGMFFADCGGGSFDKAFRELMSRCFPDLAWQDIADDDILYRVPFGFPTGAPPLWHHAGNRALGLQHNGRWVVFYHPGDLGDAWKNGHSGASAFLAASAYRLGVNVVCYAFGQYATQHTGDAPEWTRNLSVAAVLPDRFAPAAPGAPSAPKRAKSRIEQVLSEVSHEHPAEPSITLDADLARPPDEASPHPNSGPPPTTSPSLRVDVPGSPLNQEPELE